jgi:5-methylcytosine-specific restriction protein A
MARALKVCARPGCPNVTASGRCADCTAAADKARGSATQRGYNSRGHQAFRRAVLLRDPICVACHAAVSTVADHHPVSRRDLLSLGLNANDPERGRGVCKRCHDRSTAVAQPGGWNAA